MSIPIVIMGLAGRMGSTLAHMVRQNNAFTLVGGVEHAEKLEEAHQFNCLVKKNIAELLHEISDATILDFTAPQVSLATAKAAVKYGANHIIGTTGFSTSDKETLAEFATKTPIFWSPNMSVGINTLLTLLPQLTKALGLDYDIEIVETHHNKKKDSPSGTALRLAECVAEARDWSLQETACYHREGMVGERPKKEIGMQTLRGGNLVGDHSVFFYGGGESVEVTHRAQSRENFGQGALRAALWLQKQKAGRLYSMQDLLK